MSTASDAPGGGKTRVLIVDDHPVVREGLSRRINRQDDMEVCGEAETRSDALAAIAACRPDLAIVDLGLKDSSGLELIKDIKVRYPDLPVLVLSMQDESVYAERVLRAGARGYVMKHEATEKVLLAARRVLEGKVYLSEKLSADFLDILFGGRKGPPGASAGELLTDRELEVFELLGQGLGTRQIAERLYLSVKTIENHREHIKEKLKLSSAPELVRRAVLWVQSQAEGPGAP
ncbi:MAG TPA: response regulator transcription factor [Phycisphaerae bacterium]|nr:response regulator transcription factor [Phycisphaerae bacterium]